MITLPSALDNFMKGKDLAGLKPFAFLYRNKWDSVNNAYTLDSTPIDISGLIVKPNTLSMTLDVNEIAQYNANNVTLTLSDTENRFVEGTPKSYFPEGYQLYGSRVVLYYGLNSPFNPVTSQVNYTVVGTPVISDGIVSGFSANDYITLPMLDSTQKFKFHFDFNSSGTGYVYCLGATWNEALVFEIQANNAFRIWLKGQSVANVSNSLNKHITGTITYDGNDYTIKFAVNGQNYQNKAQNIGALSANAVPVYIGKVYSSAYFGGSINLKETYIKVNGQNWFNGAAFFYTANSTPLFTGVIKDFPTYKPEQYQVDLKLVSPLEMLKDIEAKDFSDKVTGETLTYVETDSDGHKIYQTTGTGVGGFNAVYADGNKLFEGVDYETNQMNALGLPALVTIINDDLQNANITADYYTWKTNLTVEQVIAGVVALAGYNSSNSDIRNVIWGANVRAQRPLTADFTMGYRAGTTGAFTYTGNSAFSGATMAKNSTEYRYSELPDNFTITLQHAYSVAQISQKEYFIGDFDSNNQPYNGVAIRYIWQAMISPQQSAFIRKVENGSYTVLANGNVGGVISVTKSGNNITASIGTLSATTTVNFTGTGTYNESITTTVSQATFSSTTITDNDTSISLTTDGICFEPHQRQTPADIWVSLVAELSNPSSQVSAKYREADNTTSWSEWAAISLGSDIGSQRRFIQFVLEVTTPTENSNITNAAVEVLSSSLNIQIVNLSDKNVLETLQDFALISGYEFGVDRNGIFFFRPRVASTTPTYILDQDEIVKVDTVKKTLNDFFTKLTLTFAQVPLEFYANTGTRPTLVDKYGVINKEIDKPDIVNYDNPELAQAIGPQLLEVYSALPNMIQVSGKLNLALELGDIVSLRRNFNLVEPNSATDYAKYITQQTYYMACKITGMNYNFSKKQITYTLRDVSNSNNAPQQAEGYIYEIPLQLG